jgi:UTP--glucose-1-phosphate uridylyltransferase
MASHITKAVIPAAGLGTRFLPATKAMPKEMLPVVDRPAIQYVVEEAVSAGLNDVLMITGRNKNALENHFDRNAELEATLLKKGDSERLRKVNESTDLADMHYVRQGDPKGLGHAVLRAAMHVGREPFAVLLGDDIIDARDTLLTKMLEEQATRNASIIALLEVDPSQTHLYGVATVEETDDPDVVRVTGLVEKPAPGTSPSNLAIIGRYVLRPEVFDVLEKTPPGKGGEIQLTDALEKLAGAPEWTGGVYGVVFRGRRYDTGDRLDYLKAIVQLASDHEDLGDEFRPWLHEFAQKLES